jgi:hypothetical protein
MASKTAPAKENRESTNRPHEIRLGRLKAAIWTNQTDNGPRYNVRFCRIYKDGDNWVDTDSYGRDDLLLLGKLADKVHTWIYEQQGAGNGNAGNGGRGRPDEDAAY